MTIIDIIRKEGNALSFTITRDNELIPGAAPTCSLVIRENYDDAAAIIQKVDVDFDKSGWVASGVVLVTLNTSDTNIDEQIYICEVKFIITAVTDVIKRKFKLRIGKTVE